MPNNPHSQNSNHHQEKSSPSSKATQNSPSPLKKLNKKFIQPPSELDPAAAKIFIQLIKDHSNLHFRTGPRFAYRPPHTIIIGPYSPSQYPSPSYYLMCFTHELGHALIHQDDYQTLIARLKIERAAWDQAEKLAQKYDLPWDADFVESQLDTYRDWLHQKSRCPHCGETRYQTPDGHFHCPHCEELII